MISILRRDLAVHFWAIAPACAAALALLGLLLTERLFGGVELFGAFGVFVSLGLTPLAWLLVNRLVVHEYLVGGDRVLEALPVRPTLVLAGKAFLSLGALLGLAGLGLWITLWSGTAFGRVVPEPRVLLAIERAGGGLLLVYGLLLFGACLGRHRHAFSLLFAGGFAFGLQAGVVDLSGLSLELTPGDLGQPLGSRLVIPGLGVFSLVAGLLVSSTPWARGWRRPAGGADALRCTAVLVALALIGGAGARPGGGVELDGPLQTWEAEGVSVRVRETERADAAALASALGGDLQALRTGVERPVPPVEVELGQGTFERAASSAATLTVRAGFDRPGFVPERFREWVAQQAFARQSQGRLRRGGWRLIHDGYPGWKLQGAASERVREQDDLRVAWASTALAAEGLGSEEWLTRWAQVRRRLGDPVARTLARRALSLLSDASGEAAVDRLARAAVDARCAVLGGLGDAEGQFESLLVAHGGLSRDALSRRVAAHAASLAKRHAAALATLPRAPQARVEPGPADSDGAAPLRFQAGAGPGRVALLHASLSFATREGVPAAFERDETTVGAPDAETATRYALGSRVLVAFARYAPSLGCDLLSGWREVELP